MNLPFTHTRRFTNQPQHRISTAVRGLLTGASIALLVIGSGEMASASTISWSGSTDTTWATGANWVGGTAPANDLLTDVALFNLVDFTPNQPNAGTTLINGIQIGDGTTATGTLTLSGTALSIGASGIDMRANAGAAAINSPITLGVAQTWQNASSNLLTIGGTVANGGNLLSVGGAGNTTITGVIGNGAGGLTKSDAGTLTLSGTNSYTGATTVSGGTLIVSPTVNSASTILLSSASHAANGTSTIRFDGSKVTNGTTHTQWSLRSVSIAPGAKVELFSDSVTHNDVNNNGLILTGTGMAFSGSGNLNKEGTGVIVLNNAGALDSFTGTLNVNQGLFALQGGTTSTVGNFAVNVASGANFDIRTDSHKIGALNGSGNVIKSYNGFGGTLTIGNGGGDGNFSGTMSDQATVYNLVKTGAGTQILSATNSTYTGTTTVSGGVLSITTVANGGSASSIGDSSNAAANLILDGGTLRYTGATASTNRNFTITAAKTGTLEVTNPATTLTISGGAAANSGILTKTGNGTLIFTGSNNHTGGTNVNAGTLQAGNASALGTGAVTIGGGNLTTTVTNIGIGALNLSSGSLALNGSALGTATLNSNTDFTMSGGQWTIDLAAGTDQILGSGLGADFLISGGTLNLGGGAINYGNTYNLLTGFNSGSVNGLAITNYDSSSFTAALGNNGVLSFTAVPEPGALSALLGGMGVLLGLRRRRSG